MHFLSDGPVTQYKNKTMFYFLACEFHQFYPNINNVTWNFHESEHGKGAPDGIGTVCKRTADRLVAAGGDVTNLEDFAKLIQDKCPSITMFTLIDTEIEQMNTLLKGKQTELSMFPGTLKVHQVTGNVNNPRKLIMKSLSCFCKPNCEHFKLGVIKYPVPKTKLNVSDLYSDSDDCAPKIDELSCSKVNYNNGDYVLIKYLVGNTEYRYAALCSTFDDEEGELRVTFLKLCNSNATLFRLDHGDIADVPVHQIVSKLPKPTIQKRGKRVYYEFRSPVNVFEQ